MSMTPDEGRTHWHGCEREHGHHACALAEIDRLRAEADAERICALELRAQLDRVNATAIQRKDELTRLRAELESAENLLRKAASQHEIMFFDPATGVQRPFPSHAEQWREWNGLGVAWLFNPWTGSVRNAWDVGSDPRGLLIISPARNRALAQEPPA